MDQLAAKQWVKKIRRLFFTLLDLMPGDFVYYQLTNETEIDGLIHLTADFTFGSFLIEGYTKNDIHYLYIKRL